MYSQRSPTVRVGGVNSMSLERSLTLAGPNFSGPKERRGAG